jgi:hypothetical protein
MTKIWMISGAVVAVSVAVMAWSPRPARTSEDLLGKAQSEFATKAREALVQRRMTTASASTVPTVPQRPDVVASLEPVTPTIAVAETPAKAVAPVLPVVTTASPDAPITSAELPAVPEMVPPAPKAVETETAQPQTLSLPEPSAAAATSKPVPIVAPAPELPAVSTRVVSPTRAEAEQPQKLARKTRRASNELGTKNVVRRSERVGSRYSTPYGLQALRAHAPEIAAAIASYYMQ